MHHIQSCDSLLLMITERRSSKKVEKGPKIEARTDTSKIYELGYIFLPSIAPDKIQTEVAVISHEFTKRGGEMISSENPVLIDLAYPMLKVIHAHREKCLQGYFGWMKFEIETESLIEVKRALDLKESVLRYLLIKTVRENTLLNGKMNFGRVDERTKQLYNTDDTEKINLKVRAPINEEELDKSIDDLVIV